ncbi:ABC transporter permease [Shimia marina]|uniref:Putative phospholipid ABC transporter permease protein MlaE n=1 Tax=Shimia marina TaxID=321267 RepID=A0A0P1FCU4_9RHOB|nr:ABC transporter permease [Shimia marina]CUH51231.1 putative phospholipid ABC transporter permease protein MlaE [Shimia marina]SFD54469.1 phospholipid/cholesterol/gamma-HCH transport system permease protein [Shimia marina]
MGVDEPHLELRDDAGVKVVQLSGDLVTAHLGSLEHSFAKAQALTGAVRIELEGLTGIDTGGAWMVSQLRKRVAEAGGEVTLSGGAPDHIALIETVTQAAFESEMHEVVALGRWAWVEQLGKTAVAGYRAALSLISFLGQVLAGIAGALMQPHKLRWASLVTHMQDVGFSAVPIVALMGFLIGVVLGFQGASQLQQFGAEVFVVELISISVLRELGILLTAIIVAGRSGSAFTASVGSMKVQQEIDAMQTLGLDPIKVLVVPRVLALLVMLPLLGFVANLFGLFGGALMSWVSLDVSPGMFITRLHENTDVKHLIVGMVKAPFFALVIGVVACWQAFQVQGSSTSVGRRTTSSVVQGIFLVIALDALFSIFFADLGV